MADHHSTDDHQAADAGDGTDGDGTDTAADTPAETEPQLPQDVVSRAVTLTRRLRRAVDDHEIAAYRAKRDRLLEPHGYVPRVREEDTGETLVLYPAEWVEDGVVQVDRVEDTDRAVERSLSGVGTDDWDAVEAHNRRVAERVRERHGDPHGATAHAFADFMSNHYAKRVEAATPAEREEFRTDYFRRNAWPTDAQREAVERSLRLLEEIATE